MIQFYLLRNSDAPFPIPTENLFTIHYSLFTIHYSLFSIHYSLFSIHYSLFSIHYSLFSIHSYFFAIHSYFLSKYAGVAELADALDLGSSGNPVQVQVLSPAPKKNDSKSRSFLSIAKAMVYHHAARVYLITEGVYHQP